MGGFEAGNALAVVAEHDALDPVEPGVNPVELRVDPIERTGDPEGLQAGENRQGGDDSHGLRPVHDRMVPRADRLGKTAVADGQTGGR